MADLEHAIQSIWGSDYVQKNPNKSYKTQHGAEYAALAVYLNGGTRPASTSDYSMLGLGLVEAEDVRRGVAPPPPPPPPPPSNSYFDEDWSTGRFESARWVDLYSYTNSGFFGTPITQSPDGRVAVVNDPDGGGGKCARVEIRDADPNYPGAVFDKSEIVTNASRTWNGSFSFGDVRWFGMDIYLPYTANEKFELPHGADQPYFSLFGLHPPGGTGWSAIHLGWEAFQFNSGGDSAGYKNVYLPIRIEGGTWNNGGPNPNDRFYKLLPLTDASGNRVMANHNRWIKLVWGMKFNPDSTGWFETWVDGVNTVPRHNRATSWNTDGQNYFKYGLYRRSGNTFPESGRSVAYFGRTTIGFNRPF